MNHENTTYYDFYRIDIGRYYELFFMGDELRILKTDKAFFSIVATATIEKNNAVYFSKDQFGYNQ